MQASTKIFDIQRSNDRYFADHGWLRTYHSFSFADYHDPANVNWGALRVFNDDYVAAGEGFPTHPHRDMEIVTYVLDGYLEHKDSMGNHGVVGPGGVQYMSAGTGVRHSEFNHSSASQLHFVQMWVVPDRPGRVPAYGQRDFTLADRFDRWLDVAGGASLPSAAVQLGQDAGLRVARIEKSTLEHRFAAGRLGFLFVADGSVDANGAQLKHGDAVRIGGVDQLTLRGSGEVVLWDLPAR
jgi:redox-sensitive bicupin YhaK (pirin superfamily)